MCCERGGYKASNCCHCRIYIFFNLLGIGMTFLFETKKKRKTRNVRARFERDKKKNQPSAIGSFVGRRALVRLCFLPSTQAQHDEESMGPPPRVTPNLFFQPHFSSPPSAKCQWVVRVSHSVPLSLVNHRPRDTRGKRGRGGRNGSR